MRNLPLNQRSHHGFTMIEIMIVISIIAILAIVSLTVFNPSELARKTRDTTRLKDVQDISRAVAAALSVSTLNSEQTLCFGVAAPCNGRSDDTDTNVRKTDGSGWVKVDFEHSFVPIGDVLAVDPLNTDPYYYSYYSDGVLFEINAKLESGSSIKRMTEDNGNNNDVYELGTGLMLIP